MSSFVRFVVILVTAAVVIGCSVVLMGNYFGKLKQERALEAERNRIAQRYQVAAEDQSLPIAQIAVASQELSGSATILHTTLLIKQYRFNGQWIKDPSSVNRTFGNNRGQRESLPMQRLVINGNQLVLGGLQIDFKEGIPHYGFLAGRSIWMLSDIYTNYPTAPSASRKFYFPEKVPEVLLEEGRQPSMLESNLWFFIAEADTANLTGDAREIDRHKGLAVRHSTSFAADGPADISKPILVHNGEAYRVIFDPEGIRAFKESDSSIHTELTQEAESAAKLVPVPEE